MPNHVRKKRTAISCDRCKNRKTKCVEPVPGPCQYCASINASCRTDLNRRKKRPYYHVSEEEYRCMTEILRYYLPDLQFNLASLKSLCARLEGLSNSTSDEVPDDHETPESETDEDGDEDDEKEESPSIQEIQTLQEQLGCLMIDSRGNYRHVGMDSSIGFNAAIRQIKADHVQVKTEKDIIQPLTTTCLPPQTPESSVGVEKQEQIYLPPIEHATAYIQRYFDEVHCLYWLFSTEQFHERLHETYMTGGVIASASWLCCLYSIFALGSTGLELPGQKKPAEYLILAKNLISQVHDEADVDSIRALCLLGLALQVECYTNAAYLYIGTAVRTAYSLGLHQEKAPASRGQLEREQNRRIWWTLYLLDYEIAHRYGNPCAVVEDTQDTHVRMPSEQILSPGPNTPPGYLAAAATLCTLRRRIRTTLHTRTPTTIYSLLSALSTWHASLPPHLTPPSHAHTPPSHRRALSSLHLSHTTAVLLLTRPFLLHRALQPRDSRFESLAATCVAAATTALGTARDMAGVGALSSLVTTDCSALLELVQIFRLAMLVPDAEKERRRDQIRECLAVMRGMQQVGWTARAVPEVEAQLRECGI